MHEFFRHALTRPKLKGLFVKTTIGNFVGFVAGSFVTVLSTYHSVERRALKNLFGILPRQKITVHLLPEWLEWALAVLVGFLVMEYVRYLFNRTAYISAARAEPTAPSGPD
ncbi:MAG TPA: hypothetical protein VFG49_15895 [Dyella sp.]|uniref:hypothetical protein n=1 Tax=Dyella sp. TaxID=1869338 RepID=UPI002D79457C|nr:hypothetical protein [Dyella sp.]HET6555010.1 hypothetical protein [Dyella sp.]